MIKHFVDNKNNILNTFIITACHGKYIEKCLKTLNETIDREKHRIVFIESPSVKNRDIMYCKLKKYIDVYVKTERNYGFSKSVNMGISFVHTPYFTVVHDDCWFVKKGWWDDSIKGFKDDSELLMLQPLELKYTPDDNGYNSRIAESTGRVFSVVFCMIFKKEWLDIIGLLDESIYPVGPEDFEIWRLARAVGKYTGVTKRALICHHACGRQDKASGGPRNDFNNSYSLNNKWKNKMASMDEVNPTSPNIIRQL